MDSIDDDFSYYLDNYKDQFVAEGLNSTQSNKNLLENAKTQINRILTNITAERNELIKRNTDLRRDIVNTNSLIKRTKKRHTSLENEMDRIGNSDLGAVEQNQNISNLFEKRRIKLILKVCLIPVILFLLYIKDDVIQAIRNKLSKKP